MVISVHVIYRHRNRNYIRKSLKVDLNNADLKYNNTQSLSNEFYTIFEINETSISYSGLVFNAFLQLFSSNNYSTDIKIVKIDREEPI